jgi:DNA-binding transcriptional regulator LsrR (DeoR family)
MSARAGRQGHDESSYDEPDEGLTDASLLRFVAELYYLREWGQAEIADMLGCSVSKVSRLLGSARAQGIVQITVEPDPSALRPLAHQLSDALGVEAVVTPGREGDPMVSGRMCAVAAAPLVAAELPVDGVIGIAGGFTVSALVSALPRIERPGLTVVPIVGSYHVTESFLDVNEIAGNLARHLHAAAQRILAPGLLDSAATRLVLLEDSAVRATTAFWSRLDYVLVGVSGAPGDRPGYPTVMEQLSAEGLQRLEAKGVAGEVAGHLFRFDGTLAEDEWTSRALSIPFELLSASKRVAAVAAGPSKINSVIACSRTGVLDALFTDEPTARAILHVLNGAGSPTSGSAAR